MTLFTPLTLPNGSSIPNRIAKAAMEENMADVDFAPSDKLLTLYKAWAEGGAGLLITGNVMVDTRAMTGPGGVVLEQASQLDKFKAWAKAGRANGAQFWMQINHPGRQMPQSLGQTTWAPSPVAVELGALSKHFKPPQELTEARILEVIERFVRTAKLAEEAGFTGVEVHAAHGYLLSQFLSPLTNKRQDKWGGALANRARILTHIIKGIREVVSQDFAVAVKLNSADFQRGGFSVSDAQEVVIMLNELGVDLVELSGGSYEAPAMHGKTRDGSTLSREAYFLTFAKEIQTVARMPIMVTGGIRRLPIAEKVIESGIDMVGMATALAIDPTLPKDWLAGKPSTAQMRPITWRNKPLASLAYMAVVKYHLLKLSLAQSAKVNVSPLWALIVNQIDGAVRTRKYRKKLAALDE
ncbi:NADH:flavin oxidoreductase/NADH oxidase family protein [Shewanella zhangzhouensis]|uniref:NADH:flavin oxidoreductase/NADH oxidase family protein n=1 Tax=Shewanella zhangzhouensis TaxID=2864213 RepID=UPI001C65FA67|nr:NADH:flavin oxidoreductase/NADH oxidase family protein [Shewanella zhangzhouensis]QYK03456.1 NADH:flavin oxidoreductase/NADH oxidase family protein [Shewanella zhangzhouensis]